jgi:hypothetical protein
LRQNVKPIPEGPLAILYSELLVQYMSRNRIAQVSKTHLMLLNFTDRFKRRESRDFLVVHFYQSAKPSCKGMWSYELVHTSSENISKFVSEENALCHLLTGLLLRPDNYGWACECVGVTSGSVTRD